MRELQGVGRTALRNRQRLVDWLEDNGIQHPAVLDAFMRVPRHHFVDEALRHKAYLPDALPIGYKQTLSNAFTVARMTETILQKGQRFDRILEIGTGSGFQTAILASLFKHVFTVERIEPLQIKAKQRLSDLGLHNVEYRLAGPLYGWPDDPQAEFDIIIVTAAPSEVPSELVGQLEPEQGLMLIPVGEQQQELTLVTISEQGINKTVLDQARFVPLVKDFPTKEIE